jgi:hypothetical protein
MKMIRLLPFLVILLLPFAVFSQQMTFCESVDKNGNAVNPSSYFTVSKDGGFMQVLVKLNGKLESTQVVFDIYHVEEKTGKDNFENSIRLKTQAEWTWFSKEVTFYKNGDYKIYVYDQKDRLLSVGKVKIILQ